jgi:hypothetical protein
MVVLNVFSNPRLLGLARQLYSQLLGLAGDKEDLSRGLSLEQAQVMGLQRSHVEIRDEMTGIREQLNTLMQMMQRNNL